MDDQNQRKISLEDELKILQTLEKIGQEKGVDLLNPAQKKRLIDLGGVIHKDKPADELLSNSKLQLDDLIIYAFEDAIVDMLVEKGIYTREQWIVKTDLAKLAVLSVYADAWLGIDLEDWIGSIRRRFRS